MGWKDQKENKKQPVGSLFAAAGMLRAFPVHFVPLQSNSTQCNVHVSCVATENCMKCCISPQTSHQSEILHSLIFYTFTPIHTHKRYIQCKTSLTVPPHQSPLGRTYSERWTQVLPLTSMILMQENILYRVVPFESIQNSLTFPWQNKFSLTCWPLYSQQVSHHRWIWGLTHGQESMQARNPPWLWNPGQTSPEVQNRGISGPTKKDLCPTKILKKKVFPDNLLFVLICY